ncbi:hypothetical protein H0H81_003892, partial [Sphagnurus paluster]
MYASGSAERFGYHTVYIVRADGTHTIHCLSSAGASVDPVARYHTTTLYSPRKGMIPYIVVPVCANTAKESANERGPTSGVERVRRGIEEGDGREEVEVDEPRGTKVAGVQMLREDKVERAEGASRIRRETNIVLVYSMSKEHKFADEGTQRAGRSYIGSHRPLNGGEHGEIDEQWGAREGGNNGRGVKGQAGVHEGGLVTNQGLHRGRREGLEVCGREAHGRVVGGTQDGLIKGAGSREMSTVVGSSEEVIKAEVSREGLVTHDIVWSRKQFGEVDGAGFL